MIIKIQGNSMYPTLVHGTYFLVRKAKKYKPDDLVVFRYYDIQDKSGTSSFLLVKRVIGVEGDNVVLKDGLVYRNNVLLPEPYVKEKSIFKENLNVTVKPNHIFVMGDARNDSIDSRHPEVGQVYKSKIVGKIFLFKLFSYFYCKMSLK